MVDGELDEFVDPLGDAVSGGFEQIVEEEEGREKEKEDPSPVRGG